MEAFAVCEKLIQQLLEIETTNVCLFYFYNDSCGVEPQQTGK